VFLKISCCVCVVVKPLFFFVIKYTVNTMTPLIVGGIVVVLLLVLVAAYFTGLFGDDTPISSGSSETQVPTSSVEVVASSAPASSSSSETQVPTSSVEVVAATNRKIPDWGACDLTSSFCENPEASCVSLDDHPTIGKCMTENQVNHTKWERCTNKGGTWNKQYRICIPLPPTGHTRAAYDPYERWRPHDFTKEQQGIIRFFGTR
jgi:hypothetical protein